VQADKVDLYEKDREAVHEDHMDFFFTVPEKIIEKSGSKQSIELKIEYANGKKQNIKLTWGKQEAKQKLEDDHSVEMRPWKTP
jgi:hypothetical protein